MNETHTPPVDPAAPAAPVAPVTPVGGMMLDRIRRVGAVILAVAAIVVFFALAPSGGVSAGDVAGVMAVDAVNQTSADSAPKQTVVNGWTARDLLELIAKQGVAAHDPRPAALLLIGVLALCLFLATTSAATRRPRAQVVDTARSAGAGGDPSDLP